MKHRSTGPEFAINHDSSTKLCRGSSSFEGTSSLDSDADRYAINRKLLDSDVDRYVINRKLLDSDADRYVISRKLLDSDADRYVINNKLTVFCF
jgi:hypothetical protein